MPASSPSVINCGQLKDSAPGAGRSCALAIIRALFGREFRAALINRYFQVFCALGLMAGFAAAIFSEDANATAVFHVQIAIYFVSLFALLAGVGSAQAEREEWQLLFTQPLPRPACVIGKFCALLLMFGGVLLLIFVPSLLGGFAVHALVPLYVETLLLAAAFLACGLASGYLAHDRAQGLIVGVSVWLLLLFGVDFVALFASRWSTIQNAPDLWVALLMLNPLDSFRINALFALQQIPAEAANKTPLASWWIAHASIWFAATAIMWSAMLLMVSGLRLKRWEE
jgi:ABC-type transport system involved in multi-copper enzyme maturation permease subunit